MAPQDTYAQELDGWRYFCWGWSFTEYPAGCAVSGLQSLCKCPQPKWRGAHTSLPTREWSVTYRAPLLTLSLDSFCRVTITYFFYSWGTYMNMTISQSIDPLRTNHPPTRSAAQVTVQCLKVLLVSPCKFFVHNLQSQNDGRSKAFVAGYTRTQESCVDPSSQFTGSFCPRIPTLSPLSTNRQTGQCGGKRSEQRSPQASSPYHRMQHNRTPMLKAHERTHVPLRGSTLGLGI